MQVIHTFSASGESWTLVDHSPKEVTFETQAQLLEALERRAESLREVTEVTRLQTAKRAPRPKTTEPSTKTTK